MCNNGVCIQNTNKTISKKNILNKKNIGKRGEEIACKYLEKSCYEILDRNFRCLQGEIDIIAFDIQNKEMVFVEVKTRTNFNYGFPSDSVNFEKQKHIKNSIKYYLYSRNVKNVCVRIDVIEIVVGSKGSYKINQLKGVI